MIDPPAVTSEFTEELLPVMRCVTLQLNMFEKVKGHTGRQRLSTGTERLSGLDILHFGN